MKKDNLNIYPVPDGIAVRDDFTVYVRLDGEEQWHEAVCYEVKVDMHDVRRASMVYFDFNGKVNVKIRFNNYMEIYQVDIRPKSRHIIPVFTEKEIYLDLDEPENLSIEVNRDRFHNLHLFAGDISDSVPELQEENTLFLHGDFHKPAIHNADELDRRLAQMRAGRTLYFGPGIHYLEECILKIPSDTNIYVEGGAVIVGGFVCDRVRNVRIYGKGVVHQAVFQRFCALRGVRISHSQNVRVEGLIFINPPHYTVYAGGSQNILIRNIKSFSCEGWSDGIDIMSSRNIVIAGVFMRNSDDCIALYGGRWDYHGDTRNIRVEHSALWADVAHPVNIGCHGDAGQGGNLIGDIVFRDVDILEHHEPQKQCMGCLCINVGDGNTVRNVRCEDIRIEQMEHGRLLDLRIIFGRYNSAPGKMIEKIYLKDIYYDGWGEETSQIGGDYEEIRVRNVTFDNLVVRGKVVDRAEAGNIHVGKDCSGIFFVQGAATEPQFGKEYGT